MPFVTEERWQRLPRRKCENAPSIMVADYPVHMLERADDTAEAAMTSALDVVKATRSLRAAYNLPPKAKPELFVLTRTAATKAAMTTMTSGITALASCGSVTLLSATDAVPTGCGVNVINESITIYLLLRGVVDPAMEIEKLNKKIAQVEKQVEDLAKKMSMPGYNTKVPPAVQQDNTEKLEKLKAVVASTHSAIGDFKTLMNLSLL
jgi:valyl-tRNA synthetase